MSDDSIFLDDEILVIPQFRIFFEIQFAVKNNETENIKKGNRGW